MPQVTSNASPWSSSPRPLPTRANLDYLKNEAKRRLAAQRTAAPGLKLSAVQYDIAREYGFASWRALKTALEQPSPVILEAAGDWIARMPLGTRIALHVSPEGATMDSPDYGSFGFALADFVVRGGRMSFALPRINAAFHGEWDEDGDQWRGLWRQDGWEAPLVLARGVFPPAPVIDGLDGIWEGLLGDGGVRLIFHVTTGAHGTHALCDSPDRSGHNLPVEAVEAVEAVERRSALVVLRMKSARFEGELTASGDRIDGRFQRDDTSSLLSLTRRVPGDAPLDRPAVSLSDAELATCAGRYRFVIGGQEIDIAVDGDGLSARFPDGRVVGLTPVSARDFRLKQGIGQMVFDAGPEGGVSGLTLWSYGRRTLASRME